MKQYLIIAILFASCSSAKMVPERSIVTHTAKLEDRKSSKVQLATVKGEKQTNPKKYYTKQKRAWSRQGINGELWRYNY